MPSLAVWIGESGIVMLEKEGRDGRKIGKNSIVAILGDAAVNN